MSKNFGYKRNENEQKKWVRINENIRCPSILVVKENQKLGTFHPAEALRIAREAGLDLVEIVPTANPPVCRIMDFGKWKYEQKIKEKEQKKQQKAHCIKTLKLTPAIAENDLNLKIQQAKEFIADGLSVHFSLRYKGRMNVHKDLGFQVMNRIIADLQEVGSPQNQPKLEGTSLNLIIDPKKAR